MCSSQGNVHTMAKEESTESATDYGADSLSNYSVDSTSDDHDWQSVCSRRVKRVTRNKITSRWSALAKFSSAGQSIERTFDDEQLLAALETRLSCESGADAKNVETFPHDDAGSWSYEQAAEANAALASQQTRAQEKLLFATVPTNVSLSDLIAFRLAGAPQPTVERTDVKSQPQHSGCQAAAGKVNVLRSRSDLAEPAGVMCTAIYQHMGTGCYATKLALASTQKPVEGCAERWGVDMWLNASRQREALGSSHVPNSYHSTTSGWPMVHFQ